MKAREKDIPLEALRGLAAISVLFFHLLLGFYPELVAADASPQTTLRGEVWFFSINGLGAVYLFFVLSGYVLTRRYFLVNDFSIIARSAVKRWPRLAGPVCLTTILSFALFKCGAYHFREAAAALHSEMDSFIREQSPSMHGAALQGALLTFFRGDYSYDGVLWTMKPKFVGSFIAFGLALFLAPMRHAPLTALGIVALLVTLCDFSHDPSAAAFCIGVTLAYFVPTKLDVRLSVAIGATVIALYLLSYSGQNIGAFRAFGVWSKIGPNAALMNAGGAAILIAVIETSPGLRRGLSIWPMKTIGELSFPIYLMHALVICSLGASLYLATNSRIFAVGVSFVATFFASYPILLFQSILAHWGE